MNIYWITNIPSPYRVDFFNVLGEQSNLTVIFERRIASDRNKKWFDSKILNFKAIFLKGIPLGPDYIFGLIKFRLFFKKNSYYVISNPLSFIGILYTFIFILLKKKYIIDTDGGFLKKDNFMKLFIKKIVFGHSSFLLSTNTKHDLYYQKYIKKSYKIKRVSFSSVFSNQITINKPKLIKNEDDKINFLFVGRLIESKGIDILISAFYAYRYKANLNIVGGSRKEFVIKFPKLESLLNSNIKFYGFLGRKELEEIFDESDVLILPTREDIWGLVINEAMARGLAIITTSNCGAGLRLIREGVNGFIINQLNIKNLQEKITIFIENKSIIVQMSKNNLEKIQKHTIEKMVKERLTIIKKIQIKK